VKNGEEALENIHDLLLVLRGDPMSAECTCQPVSKESFYLLH
jgi:hypothetical protein